jgi:hypothetical protein
MLLVVISLFSFLPVIFIFVFATAPGAAIQSLVGAIVLTFSFTGLFASQSVYFNKQWFRFQDMLVASRVSPASYAIGLSVSGLVVALPGVLVALALLLLSGPTTAAGVLLLLATSLLLWIGLVFVGFAIGCDDEERAPRELDSSGSQHRLGIPAARLLSARPSTLHRPAFRHADPDDPCGPARKILLRAHSDPSLRSPDRLGVPSRLRGAYGLSRIPAGALG